MTVTSFGPGVHDLAIAFNSEEVTIDDGSGNSYRGREEGAARTFKETRRQSSDWLSG